MRRSRREPALRRLSPSPRTEVGDIDGRRTRIGQAATTTAIAALIGAFLVFMLLPTATLVLSGGAEGIRMLGRDVELRAALALTIGCATAATLLAVIGG